MASVDVVVPCYNYARFLRRCVESVLSQGGVDTRVLILDDASTDETPSMCELLASADSRVIYRRHEQNKGHIVTYNEGILGWAGAPYCLLLSADDYLAQGALARAVALMEANKTVVMTYGMAVTFSDDADLPLMAKTLGWGTRVVTGEAFLDYCFETFLNPVPTPTAVVRTKVQQRIGGYEADFPHTGDMEMWMRFAAQGQIGIVGEVQAFYRRHLRNMSAQYYGQALGDRRERLCAIERSLGTWGGTFRKAPHWRNDARRKAGEEAFWSASRAFDEGELHVSDALMKFALETFPEIRREGRWFRFMAKRALGYRAWKWLQPSMERLKARASSGIRIEGHSTELQLQGWWPDSVGR